MAASVSATPFYIGIGDSGSINDAWSINIDSEERAVSYNTSDRSIWYDTGTFLTANRSGSQNIWMKNSSIQFSRTIIAGTGVNFSIGFPIENSSEPASTIDGWEYAWCMGESGFRRYQAPMMCMRNDTGTINFYARDNSYIYFNDLVRFTYDGQVQGATNFTAQSKGCYIVEYNADGMWILAITPETAQDTGLYFNTPELKWEFKNLARSTQNLTLDLTEAGLEETQMVNARAYNNYFTEQGSYKVNYHGGGVYPMIKVGGDLDGTATGLYIDEDAISLSWYALGTENFKMDADGNTIAIGSTETSKVTTTSDTAVSTFIGNMQVDDGVNTSVVNATNIKAYGNVNITGNITGNNLYGSMHNYTDGGYTLLVPDYSTYYNVTNFTCGELNGFSCDGADGKLTALIGGLYSITGTLSIEAGINGEYGMGIVVNTVVPEKAGESACYVKFLGQSKLTPRTVSCQRRLNAGDKISWMIDDEVNPSSNVDLITQSINVVRIGN